MGCDPGSALTMCWSSPFFGIGRLFIGPHLDTVLVMQPQSTSAMLMLCTFHKSGSPKNERCWELRLLNHNVPDPHAIPMTL